MYLTIFLYLLAIPAIIASLSPTQPRSHDHDTSQHPIEQIPNLPVVNCIRSFYSAARARCSPGSHWACRHVGKSGGKVICNCFSNGHRFWNLRPGQFATHSLAAAQNVTTLEILAEIEPGNNETLASLFEIQCERGRQHVACSQTGYGFACGCHDNWNTADIASDEHGRMAVVDYYDKAATAEEIPEDKYDNGGSESENSPDEAEQEGNHSDFSFQSYCFPICRVNWRRICCLEGHRFSCYCAAPGNNCQILV